MKVIISYIVLMSIKLFSKVFYNLELKWISPLKDDFTKVRLVILLNHTSLYEPLFLAAAPNWFIWRLARKMVAPGADKTLNRPIVGFFWRLMGPGFISVTRRRDASWRKFLQAIENKSVIVIAPEGRMKRKSGFDSTGKPMTVRSGIAEIIEELNEGRMLIAYSAGLHHVQHPGELMPRLFKTIKLNLELLEITDYKSQFTTSGIPFRKDVVKDLESRILTKCPI